MDERAVLRQLAQDVPGAGDDAAIVDGLLLTTDMLHESTDFPDGTSRYTAGWRAVGASLSDIAAMGGDAIAAVAVYGAPRFDAGEIADFVDGATDVCESVDASYVGGDMDAHEEFTVVSSGLGRADRPVRRSTANVGDVVCVTGTLGRTAAAVHLFDAGETDRANNLFQFQPRVRAGRTLASAATAMIDSSDGLARSLHQLAQASECGFAIESPLPIDEAVDDVVAAGPAEQSRRELGLYFGEDFELVCTLPPDRVEEMQSATAVDLTAIGTVTDDDVILDGEALPDRGYTHGGPPES